MAFARVCTVDELVSGTPLPVSVGETKVALVRDGEDLYAIHDECSHQSVPLSDGDVEGCFIECFLHGSRFDMRTGKPASLPAFEPVPVYPVRIEGSDVLVDVDSPLNPDEQ